VRIQGENPQTSTLFDTYTSVFDTQGLYCLRKISNRDNTGSGKLPERGIAGASDLPKRLNDQKGWKRLHDVLASESAGLTSAERQRRYDQVTALGNS